MFDRIDLSVEESAAAFNEWMRRYIEEPERFRREWQTVQEYLAEEERGVKHTYGDTCAAYLMQLATEGIAAPPPPNLDTSPVSAG